jgi:hypothetical protein
MNSITKIQNKVMEVIITRTHSNINSNVDIEGDVACISLYEQSVPSNTHFELR